MTGIIVLLLLLVAAVVLVRGWLVWHQRGAYSDYWILRGQITPEANALWYVALGDSAAQGIGASKPELGYVGLLAAWLKRKTKRPVHVVNLSRSGARICDVLNVQVPALKQLRLPDDVIVTLGVGSNDLHDFDRRRFRKQMDELLSGLPPRTIVADLPYFGSGRYRLREPYAAAASRIIGSLCRKHGFQRAQLHRLTKIRDNWRNYSGDFFHPSDLAYKVWADAFRRQINRLLRAKD